MAPHVLVAIPTGHPVPMGLMFCPVAGCSCTASWRASTAPSTPEEIYETRTLIRHALTRHGVEIPPFLR